MKTENKVKYFLVFMYYQDYLTIQKIQLPVCTSAKQLDCVDNISVDTSTCNRPCSGLVITSFNKFLDKNEKLKKLLPMIGDYDNYKKVTPYPSGLYGKGCRYLINTSKIFILRL